MNKVTARRIGIVAGLAILIGAFAIARLLGELKEPPQRKSQARQIKEVETFPVKNGPVPTTLSVQGELVAFDKIDLFAEVSGTLVETSRPFKVGAYFPKGSVLIRIDREEAKLSLLSEKSALLNSITQMMPDLKVDYPSSHAQWQTYLDSFDLEEKLRPFPEPLNQQEKYFIAARDLYRQYYSIKSAEERLSKYTLYAPFGGVITESNINPGSLVRSGQKLGELMNTNNYELEATIPVGELDFIERGAKVDLYSTEVEGQWEGYVKRISNRIDASTQTATVFIGLRGRSLREGMYLKGEIAASDIENAVKLPRRLLVDQKAVYEVRDTALHLREVEVVKITKSHAILRGLKDGVELLGESMPGAYDGMPVKTKHAGEQPAQSAATTRAPVSGATGGRQ